MATPEQAAAALRRFKFKERMAIFADTIRPVVMDELSRQAPRGQGTNAGLLAKSFKWERRTRPTGVIIRITNKAPYYGYVVKGTKPHEIHPKGAYPLRFFWEQAGGVVSSWGWHGERYGYVEHPGTQPNPFVRKAWRRVRPVVRAEFKRQLKIFKREGF
jgi:hypothetical protein